MQQKDKPKPHRETEKPDNVMRNLSSRLPENIKDGFRFGGQSIHWEISTCELNQTRTTKGVHGIVLEKPSISQFFPARL